MFGGGAVQVERPAPALVVAVAGGVGPRPRLEAAVRELDAAAVGTGGPEPHLDARVRAPLQRRVPVEGHQLAGRERDHPAPVELAAVVEHLVETAADVGLEHARDRVVIVHPGAQRVGGEWPPVGHPGREDRERVVGAAAHGDRPLDDRRVDGGHRSLLS